MFRIEPIEFPILGTAEYLRLDVLQFSMDAVTATFYYQILTQNGAGKMLAEGNLTMTPEEYNNWSEDNQYCVDWACAKLGVVLAPEPEVIPEVTPEGPQPPETEDEVIAPEEEEIVSETPEEETVPEETAENGETPIEG